MKLITKKKQKKIATEIIKILNYFKYKHSVDYIKLTDVLCDISGEVLDIEYLIYIAEKLMEANNENN